MRNYIKNHHSYARVLTIVLTAFLLMPVYGQNTVVKPPSPTKKTEVKKTGTKKKTNTKAQDKKNNSVKPKKSNANTQKKKDAAVPKKDDIAPKANVAPQIVKTDNKPVETKPYVDLGLSVKWASCNLGASKPEEYGNYYAWGETKPKTKFGWNTYKWSIDKKEFLSKTKNLIKYCNNRKLGHKHFVDNLTVLTPDDDAATISLGKHWRMPTKEEMQELKDKCTWTFTTMNGVAGVKVTGPNGNSIFLPAGGWHSYTFNYGEGEYGYYWTATLKEEYTIEAYILWIPLEKKKSSINWEPRDYGLSIRPVYQ